jgi:hypothetical protein
VPNAAPRSTAVAAASRSALAVTIAGSLPPSSRYAGISRSAQATATLRPLGTEPVKQSMSTCWTSRWPVSPSPAMNVSTPASSGTARIVSISGSTNLGATSDGLTITAEPANRAGTGSRQDSISGPFHGEITPTSW